MGISATHGRWFVILSLYFFLIGTVLFYINSGAGYYGIDSTPNLFDPTLQREFNPIQTGCSGTPDPESLERCEFINNAVSNQTCSLVPGCTWEEGTIFAGCVGEVDNTFASANAACDNMNFTSCAIYSDNGCSWMDTNRNFEDSYTQKKTITQFKETFSFFIGFNSNLGLSGFVQLMISTLFFWIPTLLYIYVIYAIIREAIGFT